MCAIVGSFDPQKILELIDHNSYRGNFSWSFTGIDSNQLVQVSKKGFGEFNTELFLQLSEGKDLYWVCHVQAPTGGLVNETDRIHPVTLGYQRLWHNGVIKMKWIEQAALKSGNVDLFDTLQMAYQIKREPLEKALEDIDGSFACVLHTFGESLKIFKNTASPLFCYGTDISSVKVGNMEKIESGVIYNIDIENREVVVDSEFTNVNKPFFFGKK